MDTEDGQDDIIWGQMTKGSWTINATVMNYKYTVKKSDHFNDYGPYNTHFYEQKSNGSRVALNGSRKAICFMLETVSRYLIKGQLLYLDLQYANKGIYNSYLLYAKRDHRDHIWPDLVRGL